ncbi:Peroxisomal membrane protein PMP34 [Symbiodinium microadriaticum]|uniref:Peroxisomal membrane protein PMP34 n=1 Tax=Symbiodinium microadriaticum TaxID=2951 RepID=A0A1Q9E6C4_SYMMI|nr:Peroxisomal membrane protein PMP34 [Symbiodinium microadriaticum]CAE7457311.1 SLC25A17 [Symbiodinium microadriaticum]CAE7654107.1 SLC25A17 [Symbiodinium sp. KB8]
MTAATAATANPVLLNGLAGLLASIASTALLYPLDQIGVISQAAGVHGGLLNMLLSEDDCFRGLGSQLQATGLSYFVYFSAYTYMKPRFRSRQLPPSVADLVSASLAGMLGVALSTPLWVATTRLKIGRATGDGLWQEVGFILVQEGFGALWSGVASSMLLVANPAIQFVIYDLLKRNFFQREAEISASNAFIAGAIAKSVATCATYPFQVAQTRQRVHRRTPGVAETGIFDCLIEVVVMSGFAALYAGIEAKLLQTVLNSALMFMFYEKLVAQLRGIYAAIAENRSRRPKRFRQGI